MNFGNAVKWAVSQLSEAGVDSPVLDAQLIVAHAVGCSRLDIIAHPERPVPDPRVVQRLRLLVGCRTARYPLAYVIGYKEFHGLDIIVTSWVLVPRPETEILVDECIQRLNGLPNPRIADIGAGSGAISVAIASSLPRAEVYATEISTKAMQVAEANVEKHFLAGRVKLLQGDMLEPLVGLGIKFDAIVSNPPYIPSADIESLQPEIRDYEPRLALDGGPDGLDAYRRILPESRGLLNDAGFVAVEMGIGEAEAVKAIAIASGYREVEIIRDLAKIERVLVARK